MTVTPLPVVTDLLTFAARERSALRVAALFINEEIDEQEAARRLLAVSPLLTAEDRWAAFERLTGEMKWRQKVDDRDYDTAMCAPDEDYERVWNDAVRRVEQAVNALVGRLS